MSTKGEPLIDRVVTLAGRGIAQPQNIRVRLGTLFPEIVKLAGGYTADANHLIMGGPMMGISLSHDDLPVIKATNCLLAAGNSKSNSKASQRPASAAANAHSSAHMRSSAKRHTTRPCWKTPRRPSSTLTPS